MTISLIGLAYLLQAILITYMPILENYIKVINKYINKFGGSVDSWNHSKVFTDVLYFITNVRTWKRDKSSFIPDAYSLKQCG